MLPERRRRDPATLPSASQWLQRIDLAAALLFGASGSGCCFCNELVSDADDVKQLAVPHL
jgi:hypothetical protein